MSNTSTQYPGKLELLALGPNLVSALGCQTLCHIQATTLLMRLNSNRFKSLKFLQFSSQELEFDLYDYEAKRMLCDTSETGDSLTNGNFSISELAPKKLFDSTDTVINIADDVLDDNKPAQNTFGTPVILRRGNYSSR